MAGSLVLRCSSAPFVEFSLEDISYTLGRSPQCEIVLNHPTISRRHAELLVSEASVMVRDLGSLNGTFINEQRVREHMLLPNQLVHFGSVAFVLDLKEEHDDPDEEKTDKGSKAQLAVPQPMAATVEILSKAQHRVFSLLVGGHQDKTIARRLRLSFHTVHNHVRAILRAFGVHSRPELLGNLLAEKNAPRSEGNGRIRRGPRHEGG
jgi:pSer/pThr/pTyr-binding forkhead associated (FHA) protein